MKLFIRLFLIILISICISSCHEKDYDIISEARKILTDENKIEKEKKSEKNNKNIKHLEKQEEEVVKKKEETVNRKKFKIIEKVENNNTTKKSRILKSPKEKNEIKKSKAPEYKTKIDEGIYPSSTEVIKVGVMLPLTGKNKEIGNMILNAIEMAVFQNENNNLQLLIKDTQGEPDIAKKTFIELVDDQVNLIIGPLFSKTLAAIQGLTEINNVNILALTNNKNLARQGSWVFGIDPQAQTKEALQVVFDQGAKKIAALLPKNAYGLLLFDTISDFSEENLVEIDRIEFYELSIESQRDASKKISTGFDKYQDYLNKLKDEELNITSDAESDVYSTVEKPFDSVFIAASGQNLTVLSSQLQYNNVDPSLVQYLGISSWEDKRILNEPALEGGIFITTSQLYQKKVKTIYQNSFNKEMPKIAMIAYDILALISSISIDNNKIDIEETINSEGYLGLRGLFRLKNNGIVERTFDLRQVKNKRFRVLKKAKEEF